jgi:hypothetical protein
VSVEWVFDPPPPSGARKGGLANAQIFDPDIDSFVREVLQNARDQKLEDAEGVRVRFALKELTGSAFESFLDAIRWDGLEPHIDGSADQGGITIRQRLEDGLAELEGGSLRVMLIEDHGTRGLTGGEDDQSGNFNALCRHELVTSSERRDSGGSFGVGKSVLWRFSNLSTVLFSSWLSDEDRMRFFGRSLLPWHEADGEAWEGSGWLGIREESNRGSRAVSVLGRAAEDLADACGIGRDPGETGTSILVLGFDEPTLEVEPEIEELCNLIVESAARWFWPALVRGSMEVLVEGWRDDEEVYARHVHPTFAEVAPFVEAWSGTPEPDGTPEAPGEIVERELRISIPAQRNRRDLIQNPRPATDGLVRLRVRQAESGETEHLNTVALQRGTGMVVDYREIRPRAGLDFNFHAVLDAGTARGESDADRAVEEFLRAAEPPAHQDWTHRTERIKAEYQPGAKAALDGLFRDIERIIRELSREEEIESDEGPDALKKLFPLPGLGATAPTPYYRLGDTQASLEGSEWTFSATYARKEPQDRPWTFRVALHLDQESPGSSAAGERVPIASLEAPGCSVTGPEPDGTMLVESPGGITEVRFSGRSSPIDQLPAGGLRRVRLRMDVKTLVPGAHGA